MEVLALRRKWQNSDSTLSHLLRVGALILLGAEMLEILIPQQNRLGSSGPNYGFNLQINTGPLGGSLRT